MKSAEEAAAGLVTVRRVDFVWRVELAGRWLAACETEPSAGEIAREWRGHLAPLLEGHALERERGLLAKGMADCPVGEGRLEEVRAWVARKFSSHEELHDSTAQTALPADRDLLRAVDHLRARVAALLNDEASGAYELGRAMGRQEGLKEGRQQLLDELAAAGKAKGTRLSEALLTLFRALTDDGK